MSEKTEQLLEDLSKKITALLSIQLRSLNQDRDFTSNRKRGTGDMVNYLAVFGLDAKSIAEIVGAPIQSVRTLLTPRRRKK